MKQISIKGFFSLTLILLICGHVRSSAQATYNYSSPGNYTYTVGAGITTILVDMAGGVGGSNYSQGGYGGRVVCTLSVAPYQVLNVNVGGAGGNGNYYTAGYGGYNGGGSNYYRFGGGGGGGSDIMVSPYSVYDRVVVAGGGGGAGYDCGGGDWGGNGGDVTGQVGAMCYSYYNGGFTGYGGNQYSGGSGGYYGGYSGGFGYGGDAYSYGGGGGGGWYGGGSGYYGGAGGGSSYTDPSSTINVQHTQGYNGGDGYVNITELCSAGDITGANAVCTGLITTLTPVVPGGTWTSSDNSTASVDYNTGDVTGVQAGNATITYTQNLSCGTVYTTFDFNVYDAPTSISGSATICNGQVQNYTSSGGGNWTSSDNSVATIDFYSGNATGQSVGTATLTYQVGTSCYTTMDVTVLPTAPITGTTSNVCSGLSISLTNSISGGAWTSANGGIATVNSSGTVTGGTSGNVDIMYTEPNGCVITQPITVMPLPNVITGPGAVCKGLTITLSESTTGGTWTSSNGSSASVTKATATTAIVTGVSAPNSPTITYTATNSCIRTVVVTVNPLPAAITGPSTVCVTNAFNAGITLSDATGTGAWSAGNANLSINSSTGAVSGATPGTTMVTYTLPTGCIATTPIRVNTSPATVTGNLSICSNTVSYLGDADLGGAWASSNTSILKVDPSGVASGVLPGLSTVQYPTVTYTLATGCRTISTMTVSPAPDFIAGSMNLCNGTTNTLFEGVPGSWTTSNSSIVQINNPGPSTTTTMTGLAVGVATVSFTLTSTGCYSAAQVTVNPVPSAITPTTAAICSGGNITLNDADMGGTWSTTATVASVSGMGLVTSTIAVPTATSVNIDYKFSTGCKATLPVTINPLPVVYNLSSAGGQTDYCSGGAGIDLSLNSTTSGVLYQLFVGGVPAPASFPGSGGSLHFGNQTAAGTYYAVATDPSTTCSTRMTGNPVINVIAPPTAYNLKYNGASSGYCDVPGGGVDIVLDNSSTYVDYTLYLNGTNLAVMSGSGLQLDYGTLQDGTYTAIAVDAITHCQNNMNGTVVVTKNPLPITHNVAVTDSGFYCAGGSGVHVLVDYGNSGITYELYNGGTSPVKSVGGADASVDFGITPAGNYTVLARNNTSNCTKAMTGAPIISTRPLPVAKTITGGGKFCDGGLGSVIGLAGSEPGVDYQLYNSGAPIGTTISGSGPAINFTATTTTGTYTVLGTVAATGCTAYMPGATTVTANPALSTYSVTVAGTGAYCRGTGGVHVYLSGSCPFVKYDLLNRGVIVATQPAGTGSMIDFGLVTADSTYTVIATDSTTLGCNAMMSGNPKVTINDLPSKNTVTVTNGGAYCAGGAGAIIGMGFSDNGVSYELYKNGATTGKILAGANSSLNFGTYSAVGTYTVKGTNNMTGCESDQNGSAVVSANPAPTAYAVTGGGSYCIGDNGAAVGLFNSTIGISYQLYYLGAPLGSPITSTGGALSFGLQKATGSYAVLATDPGTNCVTAMTGSKVITTNPLPLGYNVTGGGEYCAGGAGMSIGLDNSTTNISYTLSVGGSMVSTLTGTTGTVLDFGKQTTNGVYKVSAVNNLTGCKNDMNNTANITVDALPRVYATTGGGTYCYGDTGVHVYVSNSEAGVDYKLYASGSPVGGTVGGTATKLDMGLQTTAGTYTTVGVNSATGCKSTMTGSATVTTSMKPLAYTVSGGGTMCAGDKGFHINMVGSQSGDMYTLYNTGAPTPVMMTGTGGALDFGAQTNSGVYTVLAVDPTTGCLNQMGGGGLVNVNAVPSLFSINGGGSFCSGPGGGVAVGLASSQTGVNYQLYNGAKMEGTPVGGTGGAISFGPQTDGGTAYMVKATGNTTLCASDMTGVVAVTPIASLTPAVAIDSATSDACIGDKMVYVANPTNGGASPVYTWRVNSVVVASGARFENIPAPGDVVSLEMVSDAMCAVSGSVYGFLTIHTIPYATPSAVVTTEPGYNVCAGTPVKFTATRANEGAAPGYSWMKNGQFVGTGTTYTYTPLYAADKDVITFMLRSDYKCHVKADDTVFSDPVVMMVDSAVIPGFTISAQFGPTNDDKVGVGRIDTFTAIVPNQAYSYSYQWYVQGAMVPGATGPVYIDHSVYDNDVVSCQVTKLGICGNQTATKETTVVLKNVGTKQVVAATSDITVMPNPNKGEFTVKGTIGTGDEQATLELTNMLGQLVYRSEGMTHSGSLNEHVKLSNTLANGMYLLSVRSGNETNVLHIVIEQ